MRSHRLFPGPARPLPVAEEIPRGYAEYRLVAEAPAPPTVHHATGYDAFADLLTRRAQDVRLLARRPDLLVPLVRDLTDVLVGDPALRRSAAVFWGNALVAVREGSAWMTSSGGSGLMVGDGGRGMDPGIAVDMLVGVRTAVDAGVDPADFPQPEQLRSMFAQSIDAWMTDPPWVDPIIALGDPDAVPDVVEVAAGYRRPPAVDEAIAADARRYPPRAMGEQPRDEEYSATTRIERYRPLHTVADALIDYLATTFVCEVRDGGGEPAGPTAHGVEELHATVRDVVVSTGLPRCADLRFRYTDYPSVVVATGVFTERLTPFCGCDACDEPLESSVDDLEWTVLTVAGGGFTERLSADGTEQTTRLASVDRGESGTSSNHQPSADLAAVLARLADVAGGWEPWPRRR
ncbi:hypothetical protein GCM10011512_25260 [Tersicoccus solisilvae]|uniref:Uncharacterized protein n=1 Tax=Tersicoccus solisilvae TaxID=1882339 RepID=A0ABQ1PHD7_9MICC|nr:DUF6226 family protein [Tersicoccus solisilvae]GGC97182.1 hypothetical protein GCM10011512_25260 [Tersicoccus solisilvae]